MKEWNEDTVNHLKELMVEKTEKFSKKDFIFQNEIQNFLKKNNLSINVYFFEFSSELNFMKNKWNIFLDNRKSFDEMLLDFFILIEKYKSEVYTDINKEVSLH